MHKRRYQYYSSMWVPTECPQCVSSVRPHYCAYRPNMLPKFAPHIVSKELYTGTPNAQLRYTQIVYCTPWEERKQTQ